MLSDMDINAIAGTLKLYFRELPEPLLTDRLYPAFMEGIGEALRAPRAGLGRTEPGLPARRSNQQEKYLWLPLLADLSSALGPVAEGPEGEVWPARTWCRHWALSGLPLAPDVPMGSPLCFLFGHWPLARKLEHPGKTALRRVARGWHPRAKEEAGSSQRVLETGCAEPSSETTHRPVTSAEGPSQQAFCLHPPGPNPAPRASLQPFLLLGQTRASAPQRKVLTPTRQQQRGRRNRIHHWQDTSLLASSLATQTRGCPIRRPGMPQRPGPCSQLQERGLLPPAGLLAELPVMVRPPGGSSC